MTLNESSIYVGLKRLRVILYDCQFRMAKAHRIIYGTPLMESCGKSLSSFTLAFVVKEKRMEYLEECIGWFAVLRTDLEFCINENLIHFPHKRVADRERIEAGDVVNTQKIELFKLVAKIDGDMCKWQTSLAKSKTISA